MNSTRISSLIALVAAVLFAVEGVLSSSARRTTRSRRSLAVEAFVAWSPAPPRSSENAAATPGIPLHDRRCKRAVAVAAAATFVAARTPRQAGLHARRARDHRRLRDAHGRRRAQQLQPEAHGRRAARRLGRDDGAEQRPAGRRRMAARRRASTAPAVNLKPATARTAAFLATGAAQRRSSRMRSITPRRPSCSRPAYGRLISSKISSATTCCWSRVGSATGSTGSGRRTARTLGNWSFFQLRTFAEPWIATGTIAAPLSSARRPMPGLALSASLPGARPPALAVHRDAAAALEDRVRGDERLLVAVAAAHGNAPPCV